ncbi:hypothetical protein CN378_18210 [Bacillus sp. AFS015802]|uniref:hypothetical protein n=1 Tax=Bacillus sp. AFS015802 TaxID=2033486 RepID=UPI000BF76B66|nr:hypothetical protein [Bacillus sp. AFS015802]PFA62975.1 hypothetical protein CN378_18210 [Bacillus sp. AFS015802]
MTRFYKKPWARPHGLNTMEKEFIPFNKGNGKVNEWEEGVDMNTSPSLWMTFMMTIGLFALCVYGVFNAPNQGKYKDLTQFLFILASLSALLPIGVLIFIIVTTRN